MGLSVPTAIPATPSRFLLTPLPADDPPAAALADAAGAGGDAALALVALIVALRLRG